MYLLWYIMIGLVTGFIAHMVSADSKPRLVVNLTAGVIGALAGGWLISLVGLVAVKAVGTLLTAFFGAVFALWIVAGANSVHNRRKRRTEKKPYAHDARTSTSRPDDRTAV